MTVRKMLTLGFSVMVLLILIISTVSILQSSSSKQEIGKIITRYNALSEDAQQLKILMLQHRRYEKDLFLTIGDRTTQQEKYLPRIRKKKTEMEDLIAEITRKSSDIDDFTPQERDIISGLDDLYRKYYEGLMRSADTALTQRVTPQEANAVMIPYKDHIYTLEDNIDTIMARTNDLTHSYNTALKENINRSLLIISILAVLALIAAVIIPLITIKKTLAPLGDEPSELAAIARRVALGETDMSFRTRQQKTDHSVYRAMEDMTRALSRKAQEARIIAEGDLTGTVDIASQNDTLGTALDDMTQTLKEIIHRIKGVTGEVSAGTREIERASGDLADGATRAAANIQEINSAAEELAHTSGKNKEQIETANKRMAATNDRAGQGKKVIEDLVTAMNDITRSSKEIAKIIKSIDDIAFQTNLLALNASVEAARAGKHGKGFAVVADEVRTLARRSAKAARETADIIGQTNEKISHGNKTMETTNTLFEEIIHEIHRVGTIFSTLTDAAKEQDGTIAEMKEELHSIDEIIQSNAASSEETSSAVTQLSAQAQILNESVAAFKTGTEDTPPKRSSHRSSGKSISPKSEKSDSAQAPRLSWHDEPDFLS
ncbi:MAG: methyl-accepting chemotaxis protein [Fibrobacterota bacterium]